MPLYKTIQHNLSTKILIWEITETTQELQDGLILNEFNKNRICQIKSMVHKKGFLSVRKLLQLENYTDHDLIYDPLGKPYLVDNKYVSISHSHQFATLIISDKAVGIDIEKQQDRIIGLSNKFINDYEDEFLRNTKNNIKNLTTIWGVKEATFKIINQKGLSFKNNMYTHKFDFIDKQTKLSVDFGDKKQEFMIFFEEIQNFILVYSMEYKNNR